MAAFVLVPGAWLGSWVWERVVPLLEEAGHRAHPVTLSGLAERADDAAGVDLDTHAQDVVAAVEAAAADGSAVVVVSHSYAGMPVLQAVDRLGERVAQVVHVDSAVAEDGQAFLGGSSDWARETLAARPRPVRGTGLLRRRPRPALPPLHPPPRRHPDPAPAPGALAGSRPDGIRALPPGHP